MNIVFMGTPTFALASLQKLIDSKHKLLAVFTKQPKKSNRGYKIQKTPVYELAEKNNIQVFTPKTFKIEKNIHELEMLKPDLVVVVAYGLILPKRLLEIPKYGCINLHPSLLPKYRGCAPMERCLLNSDEETGVCIMRLDEGVDTGDVLQCEKIKIDKTTDIVELKNILGELGAKMLLEVIDRFENGDFSIAYKQNDMEATFAEKITTEDAKINWQKDSVIKIHRKIMALADSVTISVKHKGINIKILKSDYTLNDSSSNIENKENFGRIIDKKFSIQCIDGILKPLVVQREGKKIMNIKDFLNGYRVEQGDLVE